MPFSPVFTFYKKWGGRKGGKKGGRKEGRKGETDGRRGGREVGGEREEVGGQIVKLEQNNKKYTEIEKR